MTILILSLVIAGLGTGVFFWIKSLIKKVKSQEKTIEYQDQRIDFYQKNRQAYDSVVAKLTEKKKNGDKIREDLNSSDSSDLADILNEL